MSIAEMMLEDPMGMAILHGVPPSTFLPDCDELDGSPLDEKDLDNCMNNNNAEYPTLILEDADSRHHSTPSLMGKQDRILGDYGLAKPDVQEFWRQRGSLCVDLGAHSSNLIPKLLRSKNFTSVILAGKLHRPEEKKSFDEYVVPLLVHFVVAGGYLIVQDSHTWWHGSNLSKAFPSIHWKQGGDARMHGVHMGNEAEVRRIFPQEVNHPEEGFRAKGGLLKNVPIHEAFFSSREEGYAAHDHVLVAIAKVGKGKMGYFGTYNMYATAPHIRSFLTHDGGLLKKTEFQENCKRVGLWCAEETITREDLDRNLWWKNTSYEEWCNGGHPDSDED